MLALRVAGSYLKRDGFGTNLVTGNDADDRELYGARATLSFKPTDRFRSWVMWDHFEEDDNRSRIGKQYCTKDTGPANVGGVRLLVGRRRPDRPDRKGPVQPGLLAHLAVRTRARSAP